MTTTDGRGSSTTDTEQRLQAMGARLNQVLAADIGVDREQVLARAAELRVLASELEDLAESLAITAPKPVLVNTSYTFPRSTMKSMNVVKMPRLGTVFADASADDSEFSTQVAIPPGGLSFIASAAALESDDDDGASASVDIAQITDAMRGATIQESTAAAAKPAETATEGVGGFAHPTGSFAQVIRAHTTKVDEGTAGVPQMPVPADHASAAGELPPSGFDVYGMTSWPNAAAAAAATPVSAPSIDSAAPSATAMPSHPGMYGALPMPYPLPHPMAMHCGYLPPPPLMYGVPPSMGSPALPPPGLGPTTPHSHASAPPSAVSEAMSAQSEMWLAEHGIDANGVPQSKMVLAMPGTDHYNHAVVAAAAAAAAGYPMNVPFMYPHIDAPMSAAATGGSENNESVVSVDSATNRGMANRYASTTHYAQQHQQAGGDSSRGGFMSPGEYPPATTNAPYAWSEHAKQGAYPYAQQQQQQQQQQQAYYQGAAQGGYRRRGSGSNNSSGSGSANGNSNNGGGNYQQQPRDHRRGNNNNAGYQRQQRWNNNNSNSGGYNSRHRHSNYGQDAQAPGFGSGSGGVAPSDVSMGSNSGGGSSGYYNVQQPQ